MEISGARRLDILHEYFFSQKQVQIRNLEYDGMQVINLGMGNPDHAPHPKVIEALTRSANQENSHGYQPYRGNPVLREAMADWMNREFNLAIDAEKEILPLMGSKEGIFHISMAFLNPGDVVAIPELGYPPYESVSRMIGAEVVRYPLDESYQPAWSEMSDKVRGAKIFWMNYPHMPTGAAPAKATFQKAIEWGRETKTLICHDNPYCHILNETPKSILQEPHSEDVALELHSLSKSHNMAGWRVGWMTGKKDFIEKVVKIKSNIDSGMFRGIQEAAIQALQLDENWKNTLNNMYRSRQKFAYRLLDILGCTYQANQSGLFLWGKLPEGQDSMVITEHLLIEHGIFISPGIIFGEKGKNYIRISLCAEENKLMEAHRRLSE